MRATPIEINWHPGLSIFASEAFLKTVSNEYGWLGGYDDSGKLLCLLPYSVIRKALFRLIRFPVQTIPLDGELSLEQERSFLNSAVAYFRSLGADLVIPATFNTVFRTYPDGAVAAPFGSYIIDLRQPEESLWKNLHQKHRNVIRNAMRKGVTIRSGLEHLETAYNLTLESFRRSAKGLIARKRVESRMDYKTFRNQVLSLGENVLILAAELQGVVQGCAVIPFSSYSAYYMHGGSIPNPLSGATNLLQWEAIRRCRDLGVCRYDFFGGRVEPEKGSKIEGIMKFKERFGGEWTQGYMWKYAFRPFGDCLYSLAVRLRSGGDVVDQECHKLVQA